MTQSAMAAYSQKKYSESGKLWDEAVSFAKDRGLTDELVEEAIRFGDKQSLYGDFEDANEKFDLAISTSKGTSSLPVSKQWLKLLVSVNNFKPRRVRNLSNWWIKDSKRLATIAGSSGLMDMNTREYIICCRWKQKNASYKKECWSSFTIRINEFHSLKNACGRSRDKC